MAFNSTPKDINEQNINGLLGCNKEWERVGLSEVAKVINGYAFKSSEFNSAQTGHRLIRIRDILKGDTETYYSGDLPEGYWVSPGDIIIGMDGDFNLALWASKPALLNQRVCKVDVFSELFNKRLMFRLLPGYLDAVNANTSSTTVKHLSSKTLEGLLLPLPPLAEQKVIADKLDTLLAQVETTKARLERIPEILKTFRQSVLAAAVSGKLTEEWRKLNKTCFPYETLSLGEIIKEMRNGLSPKPNEKEDGHPILRISSVRSFSIDQFDIRHLVVSTKDLGRYALMHNDLLFTRYNGSIEFVGVCARVKNLNYDVLLYPDKLIRVRVNRSRVMPEYLEIFSASQDARDYIYSLVKSTSGQKGISGKDLKLMSVKVPLMSEQSEIVKRVDELFFW
jgi:type I restriction enzyme S subunit